jgi:ribosome-associated translation inhibitor RaiA
MDKVNLPIEFNNEIDEIVKSENEYYTLSVERLNKMAEGYTDISGGVVNLKQPIKGKRIQPVYEVTVIVNMGSDHITTTEKGEQFHSTLVGVLDAVERQVQERRAHQ